ncbi:MAG: hypothetical protein AAGF07_00205 [Patescibacteria group bacterium]
MAVKLFNEYCCTKKRSKPKNEVYVLISAASHEEGENIGRTLKLLEEQNINQDEYLIVVFCNKPFNAIDITTSYIDQKICNLINIGHSWSKEELPMVNMGRVKKVNADFAMLLAASHNALDPIFISLDADIINCSKSLVETYTRMFRSNDQPFSILGKVDWDKYEINDLFRVGIRIFQYIDAFDRHAGSTSNNLLAKFPRVIESNGCNFAFKGSVYCKVNGFDPKQDLQNCIVGCEADFGYRLQDIYHPYQAMKYGGKGTYVVTSSRRGVITFNNGLAPHEMWRSWGKLGSEGRKLEILKPFKASQDPVRFQLESERIFNRTISSNFGENCLTGSQKEIYSELVKKLALLMGFKVETKSSYVTIVNVDKILQRLNELLIRE